MEDDTWSRVSDASKRQLLALQSRYGGEFGPFSCFYFGLGMYVCPLCAARVGMDMIGHTTTEHANLLKISFYVH
ncbi:hypothetical protein B296_00032707 [Ensete ventricosum]|uniref:Di19 zinc-binding domain-containing protein n=1 Tax=Ensete ventricosum TaxID=4639 RepID=A0A426ZB81_ENSVE|nr:hypothetical protein B296_00032707 [Ensete ventricosum]